MPGAELGLAIWAAVDLGLKWSSQLITLCRSIKNAPKEVAERLNRVETCSMRITQQIEHTKQVFATMQPAHQQLHLETLHIVSGRLQTVYRKLATFPTTLNTTDSTEVSGDTSRRDMAMNRAMYALKKKGIDESISDLETWQSTFDISWLLILKIADQTGALKGATSSLQTTSQGCHELQRPRFMEAVDVAVFLRPNGIDMSSACAVTHSDARLMSQGSESFILDTMTCVTTSKTARSAVSKDVQSLARRLYAYEGPDFGLFSCKGVVKHDSETETPDQLRFTFVFRVPKQLSDPRSLRKILLESEPRSLSETIRVAQELAKAVSYVHLLDFVHKNIRPESILLLKDTSTDDLAAYLVGFQKFRKDGGMTSRLGTTDWEEALYCHPRRYGSNPEDAYIMQHDVYSLGVCLLEIGLGESFVKYPENGRPRPSDFLQDQLPSDRTSGAGPFKQHLLTLARTKLPQRIGSKYAQIVETCLTCLDDGNADFGDESEFIDEDGILVGVRYIEKVVTKLDLLYI